MKEGLGGFHLALWCCVLFLANIHFALVPMHYLFIWSPVACVFLLVGTNQDDSAFGQVMRFMFLYGVTATAFVTFFGIQHIFGLKRLFFP